MGCAKDIVEHCGVPRFLFSDFPLGNSAGRPFDVESQAQTLALALRVLESAPAARTTLQSPLRWNADGSWKLDYLDLTTLPPEKIVKRLVIGADVVWENFRGGVMDRLGLGYEALSAVNPRLIYCAVSGFGQTGPERATAAFDGKLQAMSGIMSITGEPASGPTRAGFAICDRIGGVTAAFAVASALYQRTHTGRGQLVDVAMLDAALAFIPGTVSEYTVAGIEPRQIGNGSVSRKPTASRFRAGDGYIVLAVLTEKQFVNLMKALGRPDVLADPRFKNWPSRTENEQALREIIEAAMATDDPRTWETRLTAADVPCGSIWKVH